MADPRKKKAVMYVQLDRPSDPSTVQQQAEKEHIRKTTSTPEQTRVKRKPRFLRLKKKKNSKTCPQDRILCKYWVQKCNLKTLNVILSRSNAVII